MPHFEQTIVLAVVEVMIDGVVPEVLVVVLAMSSRSGIGRRDAPWRVPCVVAEVHTVCDIDPVDAVNMSTLLALDRTQAAPHILWLKDVANKNM